jgi:hypothetical protein
MASCKRQREEPSHHGERIRLSDAVEVGPSPKGGHGLFALRDLPAGWLYHDHPVCVAAGMGAASDRRLPKADDIDELMCAILTGARASDARLSDLVRGPFKMTHLARHFEMQDENVELPEWAQRCALPAVEYNMLAAQLQSNIARDATGDGLCLNPRIRFANHSCAANTEIGHFEGADAALGGVPGCSCSVGNYVLRALRPLRAGEELTFSYIGEHVLASPEERDERRSVLHRRWGFWCECPRCEAQKKPVTEAPRGVEEAPPRQEAEASGRSLRRRLPTAAARDEPPPPHPVHRHDTGLLPED